MTYARVTLTIWLHDLRYSLLVYIVPAMSASLTLCRTSGSLILSSGLLWPASIWTASSCTTISSQPKGHHHLLWNRKAASFGFFWAMTETCCSLSGIPLAFFLPGFIKTLQMSSTLLSVRTCSWSRLTRLCSLMSRWVALWLNPSNKFILSSYDAMISSFCAACTCQIQASIWQGIIFCFYVPTWRSHIFA